MECGARTLEEDGPHDHCLLRPPGTSNWNRIKHRIFSFITKELSRRVVHEPAHDYRVHLGDVHSDGPQHPGRRPPHVVSEWVKVSNATAVLRSTPHRFPRRGGDYSVSAQPIWREPLGIKMPDVHPTAPGLISTPARHDCVGTRLEGISARYRELASSSADSLFSPDLIRSLVVSDSGCNEPPRRLAGGARCCGLPREVPY